MDDPLRSARIKLQRANLHAGIAKREARRFIDKHPGPPLEIKQISEPQSFAVGALVEFAIMFGDGPAVPDLPDSFLARFGDSIQNYRSALDHVAWQLVKHGKTPNPPEPHRIQFPIYTLRRDFRDERSIRLPGVETRAGGPCDFIERRHRYKGGKARNDVLLQLRRLSNDDKHRSLHAMVAALGRAHHKITFTNCRPVRFRDPPSPPRLKPGAVIARLTVAAGAKDANVHVDPDFAAYIALEGWASALDILAATSREVSQILNAPEILRAVT